MDCDVIKAPVYVIRLSAIVTSGYTDRTTLGFWTITFESPSHQGARGRSPRAPSGGVVRYRALETHLFLKVVFLLRISKKRHNLYFNKCVSIIQFSVPSFISACRFLSEISLPSYIRLPRVMCECSVTAPPANVVPAPV